MTSKEKVRKINFILSFCQAKINEISSSGIIISIDFVDLLKDLIVEETGIPWYLIKSKGKKITVNNARQLFVYFARKYTSISGYEIAEYIDRDPSLIPRIMQVSEDRIFSEDPLFFPPYLRIKNALDEKDIH